MENKKNGFFNNLTKNPFLICLFVVVLGVAVFVVFTLSKAMNTKIAELEKSQTTTSALATQSELPYEDAAPDNSVKTGVIKKYSETIEAVSIVKEANRIAVTVEFTDEGALLEEHYAQNAFSIDVVPIFHFYINSGTKLELPGELRLLSDSKSVVYYLSEISDFSNVAALTEEQTVTLDNIMLNDFNLYLRHKTRDGVGRTVLGTYAQTVEQFRGLHSTVPADVLDLNEDVKRAEVTSTDEFLWLDIYFTDEEAYNKYNSKLKSNFICFGLEHGGKLFKWDFFVTEYDNIYMIRCKFDNYSLSQLLKEMEEKNTTVKEFFEDYGIQVWCSDYETQTALFCINESVEIMEKLNKSTPQNTQG